MQSHRHDFSEAQWPFEDAQNLGVLTTVKVLEGTPILLVTHDHDGDWQILCGTTNDSEDARIVCFGCLFQGNPDIAALADLPRGWRAWRETPSSAWIREVQEAEEED